MSSRATRIDDRPDPDRLLEQLRLADEDGDGKLRGKLRVYFGSSAGVGKTYAMLAAAQRRQAEGTRVLVGVVETHGRQETAALLGGLTLLPRKPFGHHGKAIEEFDLDSALAAMPELILIDEFAHSNAPGSRHPKRWQDVDELLAAGIDVFTTLNVQHLESLNDVIGGITGIRVNETVPDRIFDSADEVILVDISADELLARLKAGKVYLPQQAERAAKNFFRKGNLMALREIALRRTADRVEDDVEAYRDRESIDKLWKTDAALLVCVGPEGGDAVVRSGARLASEFGGRWHAVYVETPVLQRLPRERREAILRSLKLAESLGGVTAVLSGDDVAPVLANYAAEHNFSRCVVGRGRRTPSASWLSSVSMQFFGGPSVSVRLAAAHPDVDLIEVNVGPARPQRPGAGTRDISASATSTSWSKLLPYVVATVACAATTLAATPLIGVLDLANIVMFFLLVVVLIAVKYGRAPSAYSAVLGVIMFDVFFVPPRFSFAVSDFQYVVTFIVMLVVGLITGQLTASLRYQARVAASREARSRLLYEFSRELSGALQVEQVVTTTTTMLEPTFRAQIALLLPSADDRLATATPASFPDLDMALAQWCFDKNAVGGYATDTLPTNPFRYLPLKAPMRVRGVLAVRPDRASLLLVPEQVHQLETYAVLIAIALERIHYVEVAQGALINIESEALRNNLLSAISHDLRTPLTAMVGLADSMAVETNPKRGAEIAAILAEDARRMATLVENLLDMARLQSGGVRLKREWVPIEEVVGGAIQSLRTRLGDRAVRVVLPPDLPLVEIDAVLIERVIANLLDNALKYSPVDGAIEIVAGVVAGMEPMLRVDVLDHGAGIPEGKESEIFEKFARGANESATPGVGLGLAICRAIIHAHSGQISAANRADGGACVTFSLPIGHPPPVDLSGDE